jgi:hypothetical protein
VFSGFGGVEVSLNSFFSILLLFWNLSINCLGTTNFNFCFLLDN